MAFFNGKIVDHQILIQVVVSRPDKERSIHAQHDVYDALVDTGATASCISPKVVKDLGLSSESKVPIVSATEATSLNLYHVDIHIPITKSRGMLRAEGPAKHHTQTNILSGRGLEVTEIAQPKNFDVLLGMDVLAECSLFISAGRFTFCY